MKRICACSCNFTATFHDIAVSYIGRLDGVYIHAHPVHNSELKFVLSETPQRLPVVIDPRMKPDVIDFCDAMDGSVLVRVDALAIPAFYEQEKVAVTA